MKQHKYLNYLKVNEIFPSIQGEGKYMGQPVIFIRLSGCTRKCPFCDTKYHKNFKKYSVDAIINKIKKYKGINMIVLTGGEPLLQIRLITKLIRSSSLRFKYHLESNGDLIKTLGQLKLLIPLFDYITISPKTSTVAKRMSKLFSPLYSESYDIKVVTDLEGVGKKMLNYTTMLMPLTTYNNSKDEEIKKKVFKYCIKHRLKYSARLHTIFGKRRGI